MRSIFDMRSFADLQEGLSERGLPIDQIIQWAYGIPLGIPVWPRDHVVGTLNTLSQFTGAGGQKRLSVDDFIGWYGQIKALVGGELNMELHGIYADAAPDTPWDQLEYSHFERYVKAAQRLGMGVNYHGTFFNHADAQDGDWLATLSHCNHKKRQFWIDHALRMIDIAQETATTLNRKVQFNIWCIDGTKNIRDQLGAYQERMRESLQSIISYAVGHCPNVSVSIEYKLWAAETVTATVNTREFLIPFCAKRGVLLTVDTGHHEVGWQPFNALTSLLSAGSDVALHISQPLFHDADLTVRYNEWLQDIFMAIVYQMEEIPLAIDQFDVMVDPTEGMVLAINSCRVAMVVAKIYTLLTSVFQDDATTMLRIRQHIMGLIPHTELLYMMRKQMGLVI